LFVPFISRTAHPSAPLPGLPPGVRGGQHSAGKPPGDARAGSNSRQWNNGPNPCYRYPEVFDVTQSGIAPVSSEPDLNPPAHHCHYG